MLQAMVRSNGSAAAAAPPRASTVSYSIALRTISPRTAYSAATMRLFMVPTCSCGFPFAAAEDDEEEEEEEEDAEFAPAAAAVVDIDTP